VRLYDQARSAEQAGNRAGQDRWAAFAPHRERVTAAIAAVTPPGGRICLLGVGNGNDVDLGTLAANAAEVHLVDIDDAAVARAVARATEGKDEAIGARLHVHAPVDLSGLYHQLEARQPPTAEVLVAAGTAHVLAQLPARGFDVVASCCVLSQMSWALKRKEEPVARDAGERAAWEQALVAIHLRTLLTLCAPTGRALLFTDLISSAAYPLDELEPGADLSALMDQLVQARTAYAVSNPALIRQLIRRDPILNKAVGNTTRAQPWLWTGPGDRTYLVYALTLLPAATSSPP
jgi:hypothetical protein